MKKLKIFFDFDNVLVNSSKAFLDCVFYKYNNSEVSRALDWTKVEHWNFNKVAPFITTQDIIDIFSSKMFFENLAPFYNTDGYSTKNLIEFFSDNKYVELFIVSKGAENNLKLKREYILNNFNIKEDNIILLEGLDIDKSSVDMTGGIHIDDNEGNLYSTNAKCKILFSFNNKITDYNSKAMKDKSIYKATTIERLFYLISDIYLERLYLENLK